MTSESIEQKTIFDFKTNNVFNHSAVRFIVSHFKDWKNLIGYNNFFLVSKVTNDVDKYMK